MAPDTLVELEEGDDLLVVQDVVEVGKGSLDPHSLDSSAGGVCVLEGGLDAVPAGLSYEEIVRFKGVLDHSRCVHGASKQTSKRNQNK